MNKPLELNEGKQIIDAISRLTTLSGDSEGKIISLDKNAEAEKAGLQEYIRNQMFEHAGTLMGHWYAVKSEYEPLCNSFASILNRAQGILAQRRKLETELDAPSKEVEKK